MYHTGTTSKQLFDQQNTQVRAKEISDRVRKRTFKLCDDVIE